MNYLQILIQCEDFQLLTLATVYMEVRIVRENLVAERKCEVIIGLNGVAWNMQMSTYSLVSGNHRTMLCASPNQLNWMYLRIKPFVCNWTLGRVSGFEPATLLSLQRIYKSKYLLKKFESTRKFKFT